MHECRDAWTWQFSGAEIKTATEARCSERRERRERIAFWGEERDRIEEKLRSEGLELRRDEVTGGSRFPAVLDPHLQARLSECESKLVRHKSDLAQMVRWLDLVRRDTDRVYDLTYVDAEYFGL